MIDFKNSHDPNDTPESACRRFTIVLERLETEFKIFGEELLSIKEMLHKLLVTWNQDGHKGS